MAFQCSFPPVSQNTLKLESHLCPAHLSHSHTYERQVMACEGERCCLKLAGRSTHKLSSSVTLHHLPPPPCSYSLEQGGENVVLDGDPSINTYQMLRGLPQRGSRVQPAVTHCPRCQCQGRKTALGPLPQREALEAIAPVAARPWGTSPQ